MIHSLAVDSLSEVDFANLAELVGREVGIQLPPSKRGMVEGRLRKRVRALGAPDLVGYCRGVLQGTMPEELPHLIDVITTNKTDFFREPEHFTLLETRIVPELLDDPRRPRRLKLWSAACSTGAEAYTMAIVLAGMKERGSDLDFAILGTDISTRVLGEARRAVYPAEMIHAAPPAARARWFLNGRGAAAHSVRAAPELRRRVRFERLNLMAPAYPVDRDVDVIFLRNVLIYFSAEGQRTVVERMIDHLRPGGWLVLGHSESMVGGGGRVSAEAPSVFRKT